MPSDYAHSHYGWLENNFKQFLLNLGMTEQQARWEQGCIVAHGDKAYSYRDTWAEAGIPFEHGVALFLLTYIRPWSKEVEVADKYGGYYKKDCDKWVAANYARFKPHLPPSWAEQEGESINGSLDCLTDDFAHHLDEEDK